VNLYHPKAKWIEMHEFPGGAAHEGLPAVKRAFSEILRTWSRYRLEVQEFIDAGDRVRVEAHEYGLGKHSSVEIDRVLFQILTVRDGCVVRIENYTLREQALEAVGLRQ
jgi:ketosteroid isomerase-like protein